MPLQSCECEGEELKLARQEASRRFGEPYVNSAEHRVHNSDQGAG